MRKKIRQVRPGRRQLSLWIGAALLVLAVSCSVASAETRTVLLGTWDWDAETNGFVRGESADFVWEHAGNGDSALRLLNHAAAALSPGRAFEQIDSTYARKMELSKIRFSAKALKPGTTIVFRTAEGRYGKMAVAGFRSSHDVGFDEATFLPDKVKAFLKSRDERKDYHLEVRWELLE
jgi:hypothetical protein